MDRLAYATLVVVAAFFLTGCETLKGAGKGFKQDVDNAWYNIHDESGWVKKSDGWMKENLW